MTSTIVLFAVVLIAIIIRKVVIRPISILESSANELSKGNLEEAINIDSEDELNNLAISIRRMRDSIHKKISDLCTLNSASATMAGFHDQVRALQLALDIMAGQINVQQGSIYLYNENTLDLKLETFYPDRGEDYKKGVQTRSHFHIGEGVAGQAVKKRELIYIADTSKEPNFVFSEGEVPRALLCVPMFDNKDIFGVMNFSGDVWKVRFEDTDIEFAETIARMTVVTIKNIQMLNVIEEQNRTLEQKVKERTSELHQKTNDISNMLQTMHQGIFTILDSNIVHPEYSSYLEEILETKVIANTDVMELLFSNTDLGSDTLNTIEAVISTLIGENSFIFDCNEHLLVREFKKIMRNGEAKILETDWDAIIDEDDHIEKIMVTVRDVTKLRRLESEAEKQKLELDVIGQILPISPKSFRDFIDTSYRYISENRNIIRNINKKDINAIATLFRNMHTIKGNARTYQLCYLTDVAHKAEQSYEELRTEDKKIWDSEHLLEELLQVESSINVYRVIAENKLGYKKNDKKLVVDAQLLARAKESLSEIDMKNLSSMNNAIHDMESVIKSVDTESISEVLGEIFNALPEMARSLGKYQPNIKIIDNNIRIYSEMAPILKDIFMHAIRNSIDHGIELPEERKASKKPESGTIVLEAFQKEDKLMFRMKDDGRGLALKKIKQKAIEKGLINIHSEPSDEELANLVFHSGLSTSEIATDISGCGVGMDAIKEFLQQQGGNIELQFMNGSESGAEFRSFESIISFPKKIGIHIN